jgi:hypothetical protein
LFSPKNTSELSEHFRKFSTSSPEILIFKNPSSHSMKKMIQGEGDQKTSKLAVIVIKVREDGPFTKEMVEGKY